MRCDITGTPSDFPALRGCSADLSMMCRNRLESGGTCLIYLANALVCRVERGACPGGKGYHGGQVPEGLGGRQPDDLVLIITNHSSLPLPNDGEHAAGGDICRLSFP